jgi:hypothetical protein
MSVVDSPTHGTHVAAGHWPAEHFGSHTGDKDMNAFGDVFVCLQRSGQQHHHYHYHQQQHYHDHHHSRSMVVLHAR